jgi:hypothetical protein
MLSLLSPAGLFSENQESFNHPIKKKISLHSSDTFSGSKVNMEKP